MDDIGYPDIDADTPLERLAKEWLIIEMSHNVSKRASDKFWKAAQKFIATNYTKRSMRNESYTHIRRQLMRKYCPKVSIDLAYKDSKTGELHLEKDVEKITSAQYRKPEFEPLYQIAHVEVSLKLNTVCKNKRYH